MRKVKEIALLILILTFALTGCGQNGKTIVGQSGQEIKIGDTGGLKLPLDTEGTKIKWIGLSTGDISNDMYVFNKLREITGADVEYEMYPTSTYSSKLNVLIAAKTLPDIIGDMGATTISDINDLALQGAFASVSDYLDEMPNFKKLFAEDPESDWIFKSFGASDGKLYVMPGYESSKTVSRIMMYRKDIFDANGIKMWNNNEEFYQALKTLKEIYPDSVPFTSKYKDWIFVELSPGWGVKVYDPYYDEDERIWKYSDTDDKTRDMLDFIKKLYDEGLIDPEFLTITQADWTTKMTKKDTAFVTLDDLGRLEMFKEQTLNTVPEYDLRFANMIGPAGKIRNVSKVAKSNFAVASSGKNEGLAMKLLDFIYSPAGAELMTMGIEGETYEIGENGKAVYLGFEEGKKVAISELEVKYGMFAQGTYKRIDKRSTYFSFTEKEQEAFDKVAELGLIEPADPVLPFTADEQKTLSELQVNLKKMAEEVFFQYILSSGDRDALWQNWRSKAKELGADRVISIYNDAQQRYGK